ncbi:EAL domain-containing protein [Arthrobacter globiformis]|uniref:EAL domain-containing protein n=1 Tax=Arthrobacter globiformis TaxID=1665 RepID=UPI0027D86931|nr:EAL domain-containing protein [Arthrobacter globiformis]
MQSPQDVDCLTLRRQVMELIEDVLKDPDPDRDWARAQLRELLAAYPGNPERALLEHLIATRNQTDFAEENNVPSDKDVDRAPSASVDTGPRPVPFERRTKKRIQAVLGNRMLLTAFQPIRELPAGRVTGFEALTRFVSKDGASADTWFREAAAIGLGTDLELAALQCALSAAREIPPHLFIAFNLSPKTFTQAPLREMLEHSHVAVDRIVVDLTGPADSGDWEAAARALDPLRQRGLRVAVDGSGSDAASPAQILSLRPDIIRLDRDFITAIAASPARDDHAVVALAFEVGAVLAAEGVETEAELAAVVEAGLTEGQGYLLGRPSVHPLDWSAWIIQAETTATGPYLGGSKT